MNGEGFIHEKEDKIPVIPVTDAPLYIDKDDYRVDLAEGITMATRVLNSKTGYARALFKNIVYFDQAINAEARAVRLEAEMEKHIEQMKDLQHECAELRNRIKILENQKPLENSQKKIDHSDNSITDRHKNIR